MKKIKPDYNSIRDTFMELTKHTIPFGKEKTLEYCLPSTTKIDSIGNYYVEIGESDTLFTTHIDTHSMKYEKVNHIITEEDGLTKIATDETTVLGGDNKAGMSILLYMIEHNIPGTYFFFLGEEPGSGTQGGRWGSKNALKTNPDFFKKFKRAIAFDRKGFGSVITRQSADRCCSDEFALALCEELGNSGLKYKIDATGYYTDTATFMDIIPECTNISAGVFGEHTKKEYLILEYLEAVAETAIKVNWEELPTLRTVRGLPTKKNLTQKAVDTFNDVCNIMSRLGLICVNANHFNTNETMIFNTWFQDSPYRLKINDNGIISYNELKYNSVEEFKKYLIEQHLPDIDPIQNGISITKNGLMINMDGVKDVINPEEYLEILNSISEGDKVYIIKKGGTLWKDRKGRVLSEDEVVAWIEFEFGI